MNGHKTHLTYGRFHNRAMITTYAAITPSVTPCVWFTLRPRFASVCAVAGPAVRRARRASAPAELLRGGIVVSRQCEVNVVSECRRISSAKKWVCGLLEIFVVALPSVAVQGG